jgi:hypothetical protein
MHPSRLAGALGGLLCVQLAAAQTRSIEDLFEAGEIRVAQAVEQQEEINEIAEVTENLFNDYQQLLREIENLEVYIELLRAQVDGQNAELEILYESLDDVGFIERQILPLMTRMITGLEQFIEADVPFLLDERRERAARLRAMLRTDLGAAQQFRSVMEAWMIEMQDYGSSNDVYADTIMVDGRNREVELLRIGRIALVYLTRDGSQAGVWDQRARQWRSLEASMTAEIRAGIEAVKTRTPVLFMVPVAPPELGEDG